MTVSLREIQPGDAENLVNWRNENARWFPKRSSPLTMVSHLNWYHTSYLKDPSQNMYIVMVDTTPIGVVGMTITNGAGELERMILGNKEYARGGFMRKGMRQLMAAYGMRHYYLYVMQDNEVTISFHMRNGFVKCDMAHPSVKRLSYTNIYDHTDQYVIMERFGSPGIDWRDG